MTKALALLATSAALFAGTSQAEEVVKSQYSLFNPTPVAQMRELSTDPPDKTESPYTVDAGHFQFEADLFNQSREKIKSADTEITSTTYAATNLKVGLTNDIDLQLVVVPLLEEKVETAGVSETESGMGDTTVP